MSKRTPRAGSRQDRMRRARAPLGFGTAVAAFALLCGLLLLIGRGAPTAPAGPTTADRVEAALLQAQQAKKALSSQNFGEVKAALSEIDGHLRQALGALKPGMKLPPATPAKATAPAEAQP